MTELEKRITESTGTDASGAQTGQSSLASDVRVHSRTIRASKKPSKSLLERMSSTDQTRNENLNKLVRHVNNLSEQVQSFKQQNEALTKQFQALELQVSKLKK